jgi:hypothetical protein
MSNGFPVAIDPFHRSRTSANISGSWTDCQPHPFIWSGVVPVYAYQRWLYQKIPPSASAIQHNWGMALARVRK